MKKCRDIEHLLPLYPEGILTDEEKRAVEEHLTGCAACRKELAYLQKAGQFVDGLSPVEAPPWFEQKIMARVRKEADQKNSARKWFYPLRFRIPLQIAATLVIAVLAVYIYRSGNEQVKEILPGEQKPAVEIQKETPAPLSKDAEKVLPRRLPGKKAALRKETKEDKQVIGGADLSDRMQKPEIAESKPDAPYKADAGRAKSLAESEDRAAGSLRAAQNEMEAAKAQIAREEKTADQGLSVQARKKESYKMAAPAAAPPITASAIATPEARASVKVLDPNAARLEVEKILAGYGAVNISRQPAQDGMTIRARVPGKNWQDILEKLKAAGTVQEKMTPADSGDRAISVMIEISGQ